MKRIISLLLSIFLIVGIAVPAYAEDGPSVIASGTVKGSVTWKVTDDGVLTIGGTGAMENYTAALKISALHYTKAPYYEYKDQITSLVIEEGVTSIGYKAFFEWSNLKGNLSIPTSVMTISGYAFKGCNGFTGDLTIPDTVKTLGENSFYGCKGFNGSLNIGSGILTISKNTFGNCSGLSGTLIIPDNITKIDESAFYGCSGFSGNLLISDSVITIGDSAFYSCTGFNGFLSIGNGVTTIGGSAFYKCSGFSGTLSIGSSVTSIGSSAFRGCSSFTGDIVIPDSVETIGAYTFYDCSGFNGTLTLGSSVKAISSNAFAHCNNISGSLILPDSLMAIGEYAFYRCFNLTGNLVIPDSVISVGANAFQSCTGFNGTLTLGNSLETIGNNAFGYGHKDYRCHFTGSLVIPDSVISIGDEAFINNDFNGTLTIGNSVETIGAYAFANSFGYVITAPGQPPMKFIGDLRIPDSVKTIGLGAFQCSTFNGNLYLGNSLESIGNAAFAGCTSLTGTLHIPESVTTIGEDAFHATGSGARVTGDSRIKYGALDVEPYRGKLENANVVNFFAENPDYLTIVEESRIEPTPDSYGEISYKVYCNDATHSGAQTDSNANAAGNAPQTLVARIIETTTYDGEILTESMTVTPGSVHFEDYCTQQLGVILYPDNATNKAVTYTSSDETVATVSEHGLITAVGPGSAVITVTAADGSGVNKTIPVTVASPAVPVSSVTLECDSMLLGKGQSSEIRASVEPSDATNKALTYSSSDTSIASVDANGVVTGIAAGTAVITVTAADGSNQQAVMSVQVYDIAVSADCVVEIGGTVNVSARIIPDDAKEATFTYASSDETVAAVDENGLVTALNYGTTVISVTDGTVTESITIAVVDADACVTNTQLKKGDTMEVQITIYPASQEPASVTLVSSDESVAKIEDGKIVAVGNGSVEITAAITVEVNGEEITLIRTFNVSSKIPVTGLTINNLTAPAAMYLGEEKVLDITVVPSDATDDNLTFTSSDPSVVSIDENGKLIANTVGTAVITVAAADGSGTEQTVTVTVYDISVPDDIAVETGNTVDVSAVVIPEGVTGISLSYSSTDESVATVDANGLVTALSYGTTVISVTDGHITKGIAVTVVDADVIVTNSQLKKGDIAETQVTVYPTNQEVTSITLTSSDNSVARIEDGKIVGVGNGSAEITAQITVEVNGEEITLVRTFTISSEVPVTGLTVNNLTDPDTMYLGEQKTIELTVIPEDAVNTNLTFSTSDPSIISVDENGKLTANAVGTAVITVAASDGSGATQTITITVYDIVVPSDQVIEAGQTADVSALVIPDGVAGVSISYSSLDEEVATVDGNGLVTALSYGTTVITVTDGNITKGVAVTVVDADAGVTNSQLKKGDTAEVQITVYPDSDDVVSVSLISSDEAVAKIEGGKIVAVGDGSAEITAVITVTVNGEEITLICTFTVSSEIPVTGLTVNNMTDPETMYLGEEKVIDVTVIPNDASDPSLIYSSSDPSVVSVDETGRITANTVGTAVITIEATDGSGVVQTFTVTVYDIDVPDSLTIEAGKTVDVGAKVIPDGATEANFTYASSDDEIAVVDTNGLVSALNHGTAVLTVTDGNITKTVSVTVVDADVSVTNTQLKKGDTAEIQVTVYPDSDGDVSVTLTSSDESVAKIEDGKIIGVGNGNADITAVITVTVNGEDITMIRTISVSSEIPVTGLTVSNMTDPTVMYVGEEKDIEVTVIPEDAASQTLIYSSSDSSVVSVDENGRLIAHTVGTAVITVTAADGSGKEITLTVKVYSYVEQKDSTPTEDGNKAYYSDIDGNKYIREEDGTYVPVSDEDIILHYPGVAVCENVSKEPTCVEEGICEYAVYCVNCGKEISRVSGTIPATGVHIPGEEHREDETAPTCTQDGSYDLVIRCTVCGTVLSREHNTVPAHGHSLVYVPEREATSRHNGMKEHYECCICGKLFFDEFGEHEASASDLLIVYTFRCKRCDWYEANKDATGVYKIVVVLVHAITHLVQQINYWT